MANNNVFLILAFLLFGKACLVSHLRLQLLSLLDHLLHLRQGGYTAADVVLLVDLHQLRLQILSHAMTELLHGVDASLLKQLSELRAYAVNTEQVGMVGPAENELLADLRGFSQLLAALCKERSLRWNAETDAAVAEGL